MLIIREIPRRVRRVVAAGMAALALTSLVGPVLAQESPTNAWVQSASLGASVSGGNTETILVAAKYDAAKKRERHELALGADGAFGITEDQDTGDDETTAQSLKGFIQFNRLISPTFYGYLRGDAIHDKIAAVDYRLIGGGGAGYYVIKKPATTLNGEIGAAAVYERVTIDDPSGPGSPAANKYDRYATMRLAERFEHKFSERVRVWQSVEVLPEVGNWDNYIVNAELGFESAITTQFSLRTYLQDSYDHEPPPGRLKNDWKWVTAIAYKF